jgi:hypothetical protein
MCTVVHAASGDSRSHSILIGIDAVETDELYAGPFVAASGELPFRASPMLPDPVDGSEPERPAGELAERDSSGPVAGAEDPAFLDEEDGDVFAFGRVRSSPARLTIPFVNASTSSTSWRGNLFERITHSTAADCRGRCGVFGLAEHS